MNINLFSFRDYLNEWESTLNNSQAKIETKKPKNALNSIIKSITANKKKGITTVVFNDGDVQMSKCSDKDVFDETVGDTRINAKLLIFYVENGFDIKKVMNGEYKED